jgi:hypothetical protein
MDGQHPLNVVTGVQASLDLEQPETFSAWHSARLNRGFKRGERNGD